MLRDLGWLADTDRCVIIARRSPQSDGEASVAATFELIGSDVRATPETGPIIADLDSAVPLRELRHLLARLRDLGSGRVAVRDNERLFSRAEFLALGFVPQEVTSWRGRIFVHDNATFYSSREWNTPESWAHPQNFKKYRW